MSSHPEPAIDPVAREPSPWTSLEIAKLVFSLATPFALFALAYFVSANEKRQQTHATELATAAVRATQKAAEEAARRREDDVRKQTELFQEALQDEALTSEAALRAEGLAREKDMRDEAFRREEAVRRHQLELARVSRLAEKRIEFWEKLSPKLDQIDLAIEDVLMKRRKTEEVLMLFRDCENLFGLYKPYFSPKFVEDYLTYKQRILDFVEMVNKIDVPSGAMYGLIAGDGALAACQSYVTLRGSAAYEVAQATGLLDASASDAFYQWAYNDCEVRLKKLQREAVDAERSNSVH